MIVDNIKEQYKELQRSNGSGAITELEQKAYENFEQLGIPTTRHEEWKYTRISGLFNNEYQFSPKVSATSLTAEDLNSVRLPGSEVANELVFVNGKYSSLLSTIRSQDLAVMPLEHALQQDYKDLIVSNIGHSSKYIKDGMLAMNTAFAKEGLFITVPTGKIIDLPVYIYNIVDSRIGSILAQPRVFMYVSVNAQVKIVESYATLGTAQNFINEVLEVVAEQNSIVEYYKIQNDVTTTNIVSTTDFRQTGRSMVHTVTISLNGGVVRNNLNIALEADHCEANLFGLYFAKGSTHIDNHTVVDNVNPHCLSNELYKGIIDDNATAVFNGKIFVERAAQKTNAFQSNKNILLSETGSVNTKPQLEIFADDVKCSHGCTVGQLDDEGLFYLRSRGISEKTARAMLIHGFAIDILDHIRIPEVRTYVDGLISKQLEY